MLSVAQGRDISLRLGSCTLEKYPNFCVYPEKTILPYPGADSQDGQEIKREKSEQAKFYKNGGKLSLAPITLVLFFCLPGYLPFRGPWPSRYFGDSESWLCFNDEFLFGNALSSHPQCTNLTRASKRKEELS